jgi:chromate transport protein ChrA
MDLKLTRQDVEAVAKARVGRENKKVTDYWYYGLIGGLFAGVLLFRVVSIVGWVVIIGAVLGFAWYSVKLTRKQNLAANKLTKEWTDSHNTEVK